MMISKSCAMLYMVTGPEMMLARCDDVG